MQVIVSAGGGGGICFISLVYLFVRKFLLVLDELLLLQFPAVSVRNALLITDCFNPLFHVRDLF